MAPADASSKRSQLAVRFFTYGVMTLATVVLTGIGLLYAMGYRFNQQLFSFEQGGLVQFRSSPASAAVTIDGVAQTFKTPGRANVPAGQHAVQMQLKGYRPWQKTVDVAKGQLLWLNYARLLPETLTTTPAYTYSAVASIKASPDHKYIMVLPKADQPELALFDASDPKKPLSSAFVLPADQVIKHDDGYGQFSIIEWDLNSRYVLVRQSIGDSTQYIRVDRTKPAESINISKRFGLNVQEAHFAGSNPNVVFARTSNVLRRLDIGGSNASAALVNEVSQFTVYGDNTVAYVAEQDTVVQGVMARQAVVGILNGEKAVNVRTFPLGTPLKIAFTKYFQHSYLAIHSGGNRVVILRDAAVESHDIAEFTSVDLAQPVEWLSFNASGRILAVGSAAQAVTYDIELDQTARLPSSAPLTRPLEWLDDYYLWLDSGNELKIMEYDGQNDRVVTAVQPGGVAMVSHDNKYLFSVGAATGGAVIQATRLTLE